MATVSFSIGDICGGGNHFEVTATIGQKSIKLPIAKDDLLTTPTRDEAQDALVTILRWQLRGAQRSGTEVKTILNTKSIDLTPRS